MDEPKSMAMERDQANRPEDTAAYQVLKQADLLDTSFRLSSPDEIDGVEANSNPWDVLVNTLLCCPCFVCGCQRPASVTIFERV